MFNFTNREIQVSLVILTVQFVNILDFMMIMPLGPDFAKALDIPYESLGSITSSYVLAAAIATFFSARYLDVISRKLVLSVCVICLGLCLLATPYSGLMFGIEGLIGIRALSGVFGGLATSLALTVISDTVAPEKRGRSIGFISGSFALAAVLGVPVCLWLSNSGGWQLPFKSLGVVTLTIGCTAYFLLPNEIQVRRSTRWIGIQRFLSRPKTATAMAIIFFTPFCGFLFIPNLATFIQHNLGYPRDYLGVLYATGGFCTLVSLQIAGWAVDRFPALVLAIGFSIGSALTVILMFGFTTPFIPIGLIFSSLMIFNSARSVLANTISSLIPTAEERGAHLAYQSTIRHLGTASGAFVSSLVLSTDDLSKLENLPLLLTIFLIAIFIPPILIWRLRK